MKVRYLTLSLSTLIVLVAILWRIRHDQVVVQVVEEEKYEYAGSLDFREGAAVDSSYEISGKLDMRMFVSGSDSLNGDSLEEALHLEVDR
ncbi:MAG: hypothetical protein AAFU33_22235 [Bacteroidota bacterium]